MADDIRALAKWEHRTLQLCNQGPSQRRLKNRLLSGVHSDLRDDHTRDDSMEILSKPPLWPSMGPRHESRVAQMDIRRWVRISSREATFSNLRLANLKDSASS
ncbi:hypothetical protein RJT34_27885 [Clitoria ternatea]|uniref:Uncharacterized protein n=1 Tax=Clitoria ternatea TaxID=43366 RepID=A0AAN9FD28_CLITE